MANRLEFTKTAIAALPLPPAGQRMTYYDKRVPKLALRITAANTRTFYVVKRVDAEMAWVRLGLLLEMTVEQARKEAEKTLGEFAHGKNPAHRSGAPSAWP